MKGLRRNIRYSKGVRAWFQSFPVYEGIKTLNIELARLAPAVFQSFPVYEGIKTLNHEPVAVLVGFQSFPVYEGIKTHCWLQALPHHVSKLPCL